MVCVWSLDNEGTAAVQMSYTVQCSAVLWCVWSVDNEGTAAVQMSYTVQCSAVQCYGVCVVSRQ